MTALLHPPRNKRNDAPLIERRAADVTALPGPAAECRLTVVIPARNEAAWIENALAALSEQRRPDGGLFDTRNYDVIVFANGCDDDTAARARAFAARQVQPIVRVVEAALPADLAHIGWARKSVMDFAATRFLSNGRPDGVIASTDADTVVAADWVAATLEEIVDVDAVAGRIIVGDDDLAAFTPALRERYLSDEAYHNVLAELEAVFDPLAHDPSPRHAQHFGASFAVTAAAYRYAGGVPPRPHLEDLAFYRALLRIDARVRHSRRVRVTTSGRRVARVSGGFATFLGDLESSADLATASRVENPRQTLRTLRARAALRRFYANVAEEDDSRALIAWGGDADRLVAALDRRRSFGENFECIERLIPEGSDEKVPMNEALATLRNALAATLPHRPEPARERTPSHDDARAELASSTER